MTTTHINGIFATKALVAAKKHTKLTFCGRRGNRRHTGQTFWGAAVSQHSMKEEKQTKQRDRRVLWSVNFESQGGRVGQVPKVPGECHPA